jgi:hypothetical protein
MIIAIITIILISAYIIYSLSDNIKFQKDYINSLKKETDITKDECEELKSILEYKFQIIEKKYEADQLSSITRSEFLINNNSFFDKDKVEVEKYKYDSNGALCKIEYFEDRIDIFAETKPVSKIKCSKYDLIERIANENAIKTTTFIKHHNSWTPIEQTIEYPINTENKSSVVYYNLSEDDLGKSIIDRTTIFRYTYDQLGKKIECFEEGEKDSALIIYKYDTNQNLIEENLYRNPNEDNHRHIEVLSDNLFEKHEYFYNKNGVLKEKNNIYLNPDLGSVKYNYIAVKNNESILGSIKSLFLSKETNLSKIDLKYLKIIDIFNKINPVDIEIFRNEVRVKIEKIM